MKIRLPLKKSISVCAHRTARKYNRKFILSCYDEAGWICLDIIVSGYIIAVILS